MSLSSTDHPVVVGVRDEQPGLLDFAQGLARCLDSGLRVIHACQVPYPYALGMLSEDKLPENIVKPARKVLTDAEKHLEAAGPRIDISYELVLGYPPAVLGAESSGAKAVVVGTDDLGWLDRATGEAVTNFLCLHAASPVVVVPPSVETFAVDEIVVSVSGRTAETGPLHFAFELADRLSVQIRVVLVVSHLEGAKHIEPARLALAETLAGWSALYPDVYVSSVLSEGKDQAEGTLEVAGEGALVVAGRPRGGLRRGWHAPVTRALARAGRQPVAVIPADYTG